MRALSLWWLLVTDDKNAFLQPVAGGGDDDGAEDGMFIVGGLTPAGPGQAHRHAESNYGSCSGFTPLGVTTWSPLDTAISSRRSA